MGLFSQKTEEQKELKTSGQEAVFIVGKSVLQGPRISEKSGGLPKQDKYVFNVRKQANKITVKKAVEKKYKVKVVRVNMINTPGKVKNSGRVRGKTSAFKKAIVTLKKGEKIEI